MRKLDITKDYKRVPYEEAIKPKEGLTVSYLNRYWAVTAGNEILFYRGHSPICNSSLDVMMKLLPDGCTARLIEAVFVKARAEDWDIRI